MQASGAYDIRYPRDATGKRRDLSRNIRGLSRNLRGLPRNMRGLSSRKEAAMAAENANSKDQEWEERTLCSDDACIGIIGPNGRCNECGTPYAGKLAGTAVTSDEDLSLNPDTLLDDADEVEVDTEEDGLGGDIGDDDAGDDADDQWEERILCSDESCIGVIGPDGCCKECGKPLDAEAG